jgi:hypothetical protein
VEKDASDERAWGGSHDPATVRRLWSELMRVAAVTDCRGEAVTGRGHDRLRHAPGEAGDGAPFLVGRACRCMRQPGVVGYRRDKLLCWRGGHGASRPDRPVRAIASKRYGGCWPGTRWPIRGCRAGAREL